MTPRIPRRPLLGGLFAALATFATGALSACTVDNRRDQVEEWLHSRPWVASVRSVQATGGPVPLPGPASVTTDVICVPGTDRAALNAIRAEIEEYAGSHARELQSLQVQLTHDFGSLPVSGTAAPNDEVFGLLDHALADARAQRVDINRRSGLTLAVTVAPEAVLSYAETLAGPAPAAGTPTIRVRDAAGASEIITAFTHADRVRTHTEAIAVAGSGTPVRGFAANTVSPLTPLQVEIADPQALAAAFRAVRSRWSHEILDLTLSADRLGVRGPAAATDRLPAARALLDAESALTRATVQDNPAHPGRVTLDARIRQEGHIGPAAAAIGSHPDAAGDGLAWLVLDPIARVRMAGSPEEIAACGGPAQAVMSTSARDPSVESLGRRLRLAHGLGTSGLTELCRSMRAAGWDGDLDFVISGGLYSVSYRSTATGRARDVEIGRSDGTINGAQLWLDAWNSTATE